MHEGERQGGIGSKSMRFGSFTLDTTRGALSDGACEVVLRPKTAAVLAHLLLRAGEVVSRSALLDAVWPNLAVSDDSLTQCVSEIRHALRKARPHLLRTLPRRGYLLDAELITEQPITPTPGILSPRSDDRPSIAVLPFRQDRGAKINAYFADGIIEGIVHVLSGVDGLLVISRDSALAFADVSLDARAVGKELGVRYVLYGGVRRSGGRLRVSTELTEAASNIILHVDRHEVEIDDLFALQDRIAEQVVAVIVPQLRQHEIGRSLRKPPASLTAYDLVLRALDRMRPMDKASFNDAYGFLELAMRADPHSALPHSYAAWWHTLRVARGWAEDIAADSEAARRLSGAALLRNSRDAFAMALSGFMQGYTEHKFEPARLMLGQAVSISPSCAIAWTWGAALRCWLDEGPEAVRWAERAVRLAPRDDLTFWHEHILAQAYYTNGAFERAEACARASLSANPQFSYSLRTLIASLVALEKPHEAHEIARRLLEREPGFTLGGLLARTPQQGAMRDLYVERLRIAGLPD
ncbi:winged helix-turn-helix domain-containing protein [Plastoroseomonas arctica]|uniref:OmpR/PhoB-type domain-containing protein n=1 Tax=Plastoroseomonas arctica TaxID=1509237 RepID=A0AAF1JWS1_9PROT|nr:winged helix-turn-helix domain-containing protein [Plastoroseomonas arctica]MBR0655489.1 hypothetical protein [Plastoroseomonas arctica]